ncbi:hypothetical protein Q8A67_019379 [Cirrhinus molitorella]|uniref:Uncharacterized protein n=1 Tax=Cirrhinus molitorella TaxID=172907 RepID=A0AA88PAL8_9TELE|nr:hypothetical protein Q8A67_019379 [Cirrhinus molitorella]
MENSRNGWGKRSEESPFCTTSACRIPSSSRRARKTDLTRKRSLEAGAESRSQAFRLWKSLHQYCVSIPSTLLRGPPSLPPLPQQEEVEEIGPAAKAPFSGLPLARSIGKAQGAEVSLLLWHFGQYLLLSGCGGERRNRGGIIREG